MFGKIGIILGGTALAVSVVTLILTIKKDKEVVKELKENEEKIRKATGSVDQAVKDLAEATPVEIREEIVNRAIRDAVNREVKVAVDAAVRLVRSDIRSEVDTEVRNEIRSQRDKVIDEVDKKLVAEVDRISKDDIARDVSSKVTGMIIDRMDSDLNDIKERYSRKLDDNVKELTRSCRSKLDRLVDDVDRDYWTWRLRKI